MDFQVTLVAALVTNHLAPLVTQPYVVGDVLLPHIVDTLKRAKGNDSPIVRSLALGLRVRPSTIASPHMDLRNHGHGIAQQHSRHS
jgi:hypothetical protein